MPNEEWGVKRLCPKCATRFYDLKNDPSEMKSQYDNAEYAGQIASLKKKLARLKAKYEVVDVPQTHHLRKKKGKRPGSRR